MARSPHLVLAKNNVIDDKQVAGLSRQLLEANEVYRLANRPSIDFAVRLAHLKSVKSTCELVLKTLPEHVGALNLAARAALDLGEHSLAEQWLMLATQLAPLHSQSKLNLAYLYIAQSNVDMAKTAFTEVLQVESNSLAAFKGLAHCLLLQGAYDYALLHFQKILALGVLDNTIKEHTLQCIENITASHYNASLEDLILYVGTWNEVDLSRTKRLASELFIHKYTLDDEATVLDLDAISQDSLLLLILESGVNHHLAIEALIVELRGCILAECVQTLGLRDALLPCATAIGVASNAHDYAFNSAPNEDQQVQLLRGVLDSVCVGSSWQIEEISGALILLAMYEPLYTQSFSFSLLKYELNDWPVGLQAVMKASLYDLSYEHQVRHELFGNSIEELLSNAVSRASDRWQAIAAPKGQNIYDGLSQVMGRERVPARFGSSQVRMLILGANSGKRAFDLANTYNNLDIVAIDDYKPNIAYAVANTRRLKKANICFLHCDYALAPDELGKFDVIEFTDRFNYTHTNVWLPLLVEDGIARIGMRGPKHKNDFTMLNSLVSARGMQANIENIRTLRHSIIQEKNTDLWQPLLRNHSFYSGSGCRDIFFEDKQAFFDAELAQDLISNSQLKLQGVSGIGCDSLFNSEESAEPEALFKLLGLNKQAFNKLNSITLYATAS